MTHPIPTAGARSGSDAYRRAQRAELLRFAAASRCDLGFGYLMADVPLTPSFASALRTGAVRPT